MALERAAYASPSFLLVSTRVGGYVESATKVQGVTSPEAFSSADLGGSSEYSSENLESRSGERFHENRIESWVSRS